MCSHTSSHLCFHTLQPPRHPPVILEAFIFHITVFLNSNLLILSQALTAEHQNTALEN